MMKKVRRFTAAISAAVMMAVGCMTGFQPKAKAAEENDFTLMVREISVLVNEARAEEGLEPLLLTPYLNEVATFRAGECIEKFSHTRPNDEKFYTALDYDKVPYEKISENIAAGYGTAEETFQQWHDSPSHWAAIMNPKYTHIGIGVVYDENSYYTWYWTQLFVKIDEELEGQELVTRENLNPKTQRMAGLNQIVPKGYGDVNGDGMINSFDLIALSKCVLGEAEFNSLQLEAGDVMQDGAVNLADIIVLRKYILGEYNALPAVPAV